VVELNPEDPVRRQRGEELERRVRTRHVPNIDHESARLIVGPLDETGGVFNRLDISERHRFESCERPRLPGLLGERGELRYPMVECPWSVGHIDTDLDVVCAKRLSRHEEVAADDVGPCARRTIAPPVPDELQLEISEAV